MKHRHLIAALIAVTPVAVFAQAGAPGTPPPGGGVSPSGATQGTPPIQTTQDPSTGRAVPDTVPTMSDSPTTSDVPPEAMQPSGQTGTTTTAPTENPAMTTGDGAKPKKEKRPRG